MKERIYSIALSDALKKNCGCVLCELHKEFNSKAIEYFLGPSLMEPDGRELTNENGFCDAHMNALLSSGHRLGLALILETHVDTLLKKLKPQMKKGLFKEEYDFDASGAQIAKAFESCCICNKIAKQIKDAAENLVYLWDKESDFKEAFEKSYGLCLNHTGLVLSVCKNELSSKKATEFADTIYALQREKLQKHYNDLHEFTLSFDYRNKDKELSEDAKNSVADAVRRLTTATED